MGLSKEAEELLTEGTLGADEEAISSAVDLSKASHCTLTVEVEFDPNADAGLTAHVRSSYDNSNWDTQDIGDNEQGYWGIPDNFSSGDHAGSLIQSTVPVEEVFKYLRVHVENNGTIAANNVAVTSVKQDVDAY